MRYVHAANNRWYPAPRRRGRPNPGRSRNGGGGGFPWLLAGGGVLLYMMMSRPGGLPAFFRPAGAAAPGASVPTFGTALLQSGIQTIPTLFRGLSQIIGGAFQVPTVDAGMNPNFTIPFFQEETAPFAIPDVGWTVWDIGLPDFTVV